jgi:hypothetical protein
MIHARYSEVHSEMQQWVSHCLKKVASQAVERSLCGTVKGNMKKLHRQTSEQGKPNHQNTTSMCTNHQHTSFKERHITARNTNTKTKSNA